jgi:hypothetical protein
MLRGINEMNMRQQRIHEYKQTGLKARLTIPEVKVE